MSSSPQPQRTVEQEFVVSNLVKLAKHHKKHCDGESCCITLCALLMLCDMAEIFLTEEESSAFL